MFASASYAHLKCSKVPKATLKVSEKRVKLKDQFEIKKQIEIANLELCLWSCSKFNLAMNVKMKELLANPLHFEISLVQVRKNKTCKRDKFGGSFWINRGKFRK